MNRMSIDPLLASQLKDKYNAEGTVLRRAQLRMLEMLIFIDTICKKNNLTYWLDGGTLLGAVRHGGFIPWDDDTDICMPAKDAEKFKHIMLTEYPNTDFVLQCKETDNGYFGAWYVLRDKNSEYIQNSKLHNKRQYRGLQVDIFIVEDQVNDVFWHFSLLYQKVIDKFLNTSNSLFFSAIFAKPLYYIFHLFLIPIFRITSKRSAFYSMPYGSIWKYKLNKKSIYPLSQCTFENYDFFAPGNYDQYLKTEFGNWQDIPQNIWNHQANIVLK
jgi:lipopolysaccharide cholinephosphotransferase